MLQRLGEQEGNEIIVLIEHPESVQDSSANSDFNTD